MKRDISFITRIVKQMFLQNELTKIDDFTTYSLPGDIVLENIYLETKDNIKIGCWVLKPVNIDKSTQCILVLHSNGCNRKLFTENFRFDRLLAYNYILVVSDYRSFGDSQGDFWIDTVNFDVEAAHKHCINAYKKEPSFLGYSLGGAIALEYLKYSKHKNKLVIISTFSSTVDILNTVGLWRFVSYLVPYAEQKIVNEFNFDCSTNIRNANKENVLIIHGSVDEMIPCEQGKKLAEIARCRFIEMKNHDHFSLFSDGSIFVLIDNFLQSKIKSSML
ncbi:hypothetical protein BDAP_001443 [Binucleata daphniae]